MPSHQGGGGESRSKASRTIRCGRPAGHVAIPGLQAQRALAAAELTPQLALWVGIAPNDVRLIQTA